MAANTAPIYTLVPHVSWGATDGDGGAAGPLKTANTARDGTGTVLTLFTGTTNGSFVKNIGLVAVGTNTASVVRVFVNNGSTNATLANNIQIAEKTLPATTLSAVAETAAVEIILNLPIPNGYKIFVTLGTTVAAGYNVYASGGDY